MDNLEFELHKVKREIQRHGNEYKFYRATKNEFGEPVGEESVTAVIKGIYHEERGYVSLTIKEGANVRSKPEPQILCIIDQESEDAEYDDGVVVMNIEGEVVDVEEGPDEEFGGFENDVSSWGLNRYKVKQDDVVYVGRNRYRVVDVVDIQNYGIIANISLEMEV